jgi:hypothetical protein
LCFFGGAGLGGGVDLAGVELGGGESGVRAPLYAPRAPARPR